MKLFWKDRYWCSTDDDVISELRSLFALSSFSNMVVIVDSVVAKAFPVLLSLAEPGVRVFSFPGGEKAKSIEDKLALSQNKNE